MARQTSASAASPRKPRVYLAGPDVFDKNHNILAANKKQICAEYGLEGRAPLDAVLDLSKYTTPQAKGLAIASANEALIRECDAVIANLTPFRGVSADVGTVYELGYATALGKRVFAYTTETARYAARVENGFGPVDETGRDRNGEEVEPFDLHDNLMLDGGLANRGRPLVVDCQALRGFAECVKMLVADLNRNPL
jgi:nucleoside 2-deoxyribosyltransferase